MDKLINFFSKFPGIGPRQAKRFAYYILTREPSYIEDFIKTLTEVSKITRLCDDCHRLFQHKNSTLCSICANESRDKSILAIVAKDVDLENIEKSGTFYGSYFVLGGSVPLTEESPMSVRINELKNRIEDDIIIKEIIFALNANPEGDHTGQIVEIAIRQILDKKNIKTSHLARGLSTGTELEYSDRDTLSSAIRNRS